MSNHTSHDTKRAVVVGVFTIAAIVATAVLMSTRGREVWRRTFAKTGLEGDILPHDNLRAAERYLPDNIYTALDYFNNAEWTTKLFGEDVKARYADLKKAAADRCLRLLGTFVKTPEVQYHHEIYNQFLWNMF